MLPAEQSPEADLGPLITTRKRSWLDKIVFGVLFTLMGLGSIAVLIAGLTQAPDLAGQLGCAFLSALFLFGTIRGVWAIFHTVEFYQQGAVSRRFGIVRTFQYTDAVSLDYALVRRYVHGVYAGTTMTVTLRMADKRKLRFRGRHKEHPKGLAITIFGKKFEGEDEMDVVREVIAAHIADRLAEELAQSGSFRWSNSILLWCDGVTAMRGKRKNQLVTWPEIRGFTTKNGFFHIIAHGDEKSFIWTACNGRNFYPGLHLLRTLMDTAKRPSLQSAR